MLARMKTPQAGDTIFVDITPYGDSDVRIRIWQARAGRVRAVLGNGRELGIVFQYDERRDLRRIRAGIEFARIVQSALHLCDHAYVSARPRGRVGAWVFCGRGRVRRTGVVMM